MNTQRLEWLVADFLGVRENLIVPNVKYGFYGMPYEADLIVVAPSMYATEIELKVSKSDIKADNNKEAYAHKSKRIKRFFYAVPDELKDCEYLPIDCGLIIARERIYSNGQNCMIVRPPRINKDAKKLTEQEYRVLLRLCAMRVWTLKERLVRK
jgi:hypothetical protein